jgi:hypothetical protein
MILWSCYASTSSVLKSESLSRVFFFWTDEERKLAPTTVAMELNPEMEETKKLRADYESKTSLFRTLHLEEVKRGERTERELQSCKDQLASALKQLEATKTAAAAERYSAVQMTTYRDQQAQLR